MTFKPIPATPLLILILCLLAYCKLMQDSSDSLEKEFKQYKADVDQAINSSYQECQNIRFMDRKINEKTGCMDTIELLCEERAKKPLDCIDELKDICIRIGE